MSVTFNGKSGDIEGDGWNLMGPDHRSTGRWRPQTAGRNKTNICECTADSLLTKWLLIKIRL